MLLHMVVVVAVDYDDIVYLAAARWLLLLYLDSCCFSWFYEVEEDADR